jgi:PKD repeat protein
MDARPCLLTLALTLVVAPNALAAPPDVDFAYAPSTPNEGETVSFSAAVSWGGNTPGTVSWDFGDGTTATGLDVEHVFTSPGTKQVTVIATNGEGEQSTPAIKQIDVNARPSVTFAFSPEDPESGEPILFAADARDDDPVSYLWEFGDGSAATGSSATHAYDTPGVRTVTLTVTDSEGASGTASLAVDVRAPASLPAAAPPAPPSVKALTFMSPFPVVRLSGQVVGRLTLVRLLTIRGPRGAQVRVQCTGTDCPAELVRRRVKRTGVVRLRGFERTLRPGTRLAIFVRRGEEIGKYTRFAIRAGKRPLRTDRCLFPGRRTPERCPA